VPDIGKEQLRKVFAASPDAISVNRLLGEVRG
jgi:hypothetical protein